MILIVIVIQSDYEYMNVHLACDDCRDSTTTSSRKKSNLYVYVSTNSYWPKNYVGG